MTLSGPDALRSIEEALRDIRREEDEAVRKLARNVELSAKLRAQEAEIVRQLAAMRLEGAARGTLAGELERIEAGTSAMIEAHELKLEAAEAGLAGLDAKLLQASSDRSGLKAEAAARERELRTLTDKARPRLGTDPGYAEKLGAARELSAIAEASLAKTMQAEADREVNGRPYRDDPLFMYLWTRGFGTKSYKANPLVRWLDGRVADVIGYAAARTNFTMLNEIPLRLRDYAEARQDRARAAAAEIAALESVAVDSAGGRMAREAIVELGGKIGGLDREIVTLQDRRDEAIKTQRELAQGAETAFDAALEEMRKVLDGVAVTWLLGDARSTPKGQDLPLLQQLEDLKQRAEEEAEEAREHRSRLKILAARRRDLEDIQYEIKAQGFDGPASSFAEDHLSDERLNGLLRGELTAYAYWEKLRDSHSFAASSDLAPPQRPAGGLNRPRGAARAEAAA